MKKILLVDLDDTLLSFKKSSDVSLEKVMKHYGIPYTQENCDLYEKINLKYWEMYERGEITRDIILEKRFSDFCAHFGLTINSKEANDLYISSLQTQVFFMDNAIDFLEECKKRKMTICLVSNGVGYVQTPRLKLSNIINYLTKKYISEEVGYAKPSVKFFQKIFDDFPHQKEDMVIVGDSLTSDIQGGINAGITTVWLNTKNKTSNLPDFEIHNLMEFFNLDIMK